MVLPSALVLAGLTAWWIHQVRAERLGEIEHWLEVERKARAAMERDPQALVSYERLATALEKLGRDEEAIAALRLWLEHEPASREARDRLRRFQERDASVEAPPPPPPPPPPPAPKPARDLGGVDLSDMLGVAPTAPPPALTEEQLLTAFAPDDEEAPDERPTFDNYGVAPEDLPAHDAEHQS
jgi:hypothetical protein